MQYSVLCLSLDLSSLILTHPPAHTGNAADHGIGKRLQSKKLHICSVPTLQADPHPGKVSGKLLAEQRHIGNALLDCSSHAQLFIYLLIGAAKIKKTENERCMCE